MSETEEIAPQIAQLRDKEVVPIEEVKSSVPNNSMKFINVQYTW